MIDALGGFVLTAAEVAVRQVYWRVPALVSLVTKARRRAHVAGVAPVGLDLVEERLRAILEGRTRLVLVHSSLDRLAIRLPGSLTPANPISAASALLRVLTRVVGPDGTLAMPTHPRYPNDDFMRDTSSLVLDYDPKRTPSNVGLLTELFRLARGTQRSLHPLSSLACSGPLAEMLLHDNLNERRPLPHGVDSGYARICREGGIVVSIGLPLIKCVTIFHTHEDTADGEWPIPNFFRERRFRVAGTRDEEWIVRERRPQFARCCAIWRMRREWLREGILHESDSDGLRIDWALASDIREFLRPRRTSGYPYYLTRLSGAPRGQR